MQIWAFSPTKTVRVFHFDFNVGRAGALPTALLQNAPVRMSNTIRAKTNVNGGAIALGHPLGASGARIMTTMACCGRPLVSRALTRTLPAIRCVTGLPT
jgi:hypothetical protein